MDNTLFGPASIPAGNNASPRTAWAPENQTSSGSGTDSDPFRVVTTVSGGGLRLVQNDTYTAGVEFYGTKVSVTNTTASSKSITVYRAGDCYLQNNDRGYGVVDAAAGAVACTTGLTPGSRIEQWAPLTAGSKFLESGFSTVWSAIGSRQPFPNTCQCATYQDNGAGLSWTTTVGPGVTKSFSHLTSFSPTGITQVKDSDGDSFPDTWEDPAGGVDTDGNGTPDLKLSDYGATPDKKDVFVQIGSTKTPAQSCVLFFCRDTSPNRRPSLQALADVQEAFKRKGIRLHIDAGNESLMNPDTGAKWGNRSRVNDAIETPTTIAGWNASTQTMTWTQFDQWAPRVFSASSQRGRLFHSVIYVGNYDGLPRGQASTGIARGIGSNDVIFAADAFGDRSRRVEAGTLMHELGHTLGLTHGGSLVQGDEGKYNYKPNYPSVMNYWWQFTGYARYSPLAWFISHFSDTLDYSSGTLADLNEQQLRESSGLGPDPTANEFGTKWSCPDRSIHGLARAGENLNWNCTGSDSETTETSGNVNNPRRAQANTSQDVLSDYNDWQNLVFDGGGTIGGAGDAQAAPTVSVGVEATYAELKEASGNLSVVELGGPARLAMQAHTSAPLTLAIKNTRSDTRSYKLVVTASSGVEVSGLPNSVVLAPGESKTLTVTLTAGDPSESAFFEINASHEGGDATDASSLVTETRIINDAVPDQPRFPANMPPLNPTMPPAAGPAGGTGGGRPGSAAATCRELQTSRTIKIKLSGRARKSGIARPKTGRIPQLGKGRNITYRVMLTRKCVTIATGTIKGKTLKLAVKPTGVKAVKKGNKKIKVKVYPRLSGKYILQSNGGTAKIDAVKLAFK